MFEQRPKEEKFHLIKELEINPAATQRSLSEKLGLSLGKTNYLLKELAEEGLIEVKNENGNSGKPRKIRYLLTKEGIEHKAKLIQYFLKQKEREYNFLKAEWEHISLGLK